MEFAQKYAHRVAFLMTKAINALSAIQVAAPVEVKQTSARHARILSL
jgi:hypothetical protein